VVITFSRRGRMGGRRDGWIGGLCVRYGWMVCEVWADMWV
jgi:hypothetical protein